MSEKTPSTPASDRAREAWESVPGDSEAAVDYPDGKVGVANDRTSPGFTGGPVMTLGDELTEYYDLSVEISIRTPDGTTFTYGERVECKAEDDYTLDEAITMLDASYHVMSERLGR